jgi:hypothetical protein
VSKKPLKKEKAKPALPPAPKAAKAAKAPATVHQIHERRAKPSEEDAIERGRTLATSYIIQRDGMDAETAAMVVSGMEPEEINALIAEANSAVLADHLGTPGDEEVKAATKPKGKKGKPKGDGLMPDAEVPMVDFMTIPALVEFTDPDSQLAFGDLVIVAAIAAHRKNEAEKEYKEAKAAIVKVMLQAGLRDSGVMCLDHKVTHYTGHNITIPEQNLLDHGVDPDIIVASRKDTPYEDVRITAPKAGV